MINVSAYQFTPLSQDALPCLRERLLKESRGLGVKGSILLATEGINLFLSGPQAIIDSMLTYIRSLGFSFEAKLSPSPETPFKRMLVKIKTETISMGQEAIKPGMKKAPYVDPKTLKAWLDDGQSCVLLDTRNDYEVRLGAFSDAIDFNLKKFRDFPEAIKKAAEKIGKHKKIVTYCTGGIRCEKAALYMQDLGFDEVYQLEGGILKYFEECGKAHYEGECFVFDKRVAVDETLAPTDTIQCFACRQPLTSQIQQAMKDTNYVCPYCEKNIANQFVTVQVE